MSPLEIGSISLLVLVILLFSGIPIGVVMGIVGFAGIVLLSGLVPALNVLKTVPYTVFSNYGLSVIPLFILMGSFCFYAGISKNLYDAVHNLLGNRRGGLAMATVGACAGFAAISGSSLATAATMGTVALPEMKRFKYKPSLALGAIAAGGTIGILIPPSVPLIIYGVITQQSIGKLLMAGIIPGITQALFYLAVIYIICRVNPLAGPPGPVTTLREKLVAIKDTWFILLLFAIVIGGIYLGIFSPTEAAGIGAFGAFVFALLRGNLGWKNLRGSLTETTKTTAMIFVILVGAMILGYFLTVTRIPFELAGFIGGLSISPYAVLFAILVIYLCLGCLMDSLAMMLLTVPIFFPLMMELGFDPIWFGIIVVRMVEVGLITPPVGLNVFIIKGISKDTEMFTIFKGVAPFLAADALHIALLIAVPEIVTFLPSRM